MGDYQTASTLFSEHLSQKIGLHAHLRIHPLETTVLFGHFLHLVDQGHIHTAERGTPLLKIGTAHAMLTAQLRDRRTEVVLLFRTGLRLG